MTKPPPHPLLRAALFIAAYVFGMFAVQLPVFLILSLLSGGLDLAASEALQTGNVPAELFLWLSWPSFIFNLGLAALFHAWGRQDPLLGLRLHGGRAGRDTLLGLALGLGSMAVIAAGFAALGWANFSALGSPGTLLGLVVVFLALLPAAASEEVIFRGYLLPVIEGWRGWPLAVAVSSVLFALGHALNPNVSPLALANLVLAGVAFALAYHLTRSLWLPIAYHLAWNFAQGPLLGFEVSGLSFQALMRAEVTGPTLWTGGAFGPEGGLGVTLLLLATCAGLRLWDRGKRLAV